MAEKVQVRLDKRLVDAAELIGNLQHRSKQKQLEHWISIGQVVSPCLNDTEYFELLAQTENTNSIVRNLVTRCMEMPKAKATPLASTDQQQVSAH